MIDATERWRLFIAIELDEQARRIFTAAIAACRQAEVPARWVDPRLAHLTVLFLGDVPPEKTGRIGRALTSVTARYPRIELSTARLGAFPEGRNARVIWVGIEDPTGRLRRLYGELRTAIGAIGLPVESRPFHPHLTVGRARAGVVVPAPALDAARSTFARVPAAVFPLRELALIRSELGPGGPRYTTLHTAPVGPHG